MADHSFQNDNILIETPKGKVIQREYTKGQNKGKTYVRIVWNTGFGKSMTGKLQSAQAMLDSEVMRLMEPYMPMETGAMIASMQVSTYIGSGRVEVATPYASRVYHNNGKIGRPTGPLRGPRYFDRMKADNMPQLQRIIEHKTGGKIK